MPLLCCSIGLVFSWKRCMLIGFKIPFFSFLMLSQCFYKIGLLDMFFYIPLEYLFFSLALLSKCGNKVNL